MELKSTLNLPKTNFPIKPKLENDFRFDSMGNVSRRLRRGRREADFVLHDGPPYANGDIHVGHALNKVLKDFVAKYRYFRGESVEFVPGWDCHGLPIEKKVSDKGKARDDLHLRQLCRDYAASQVALQREQFERLGVHADWENPYLTMNKGFEDMVFGSLCDLAKKGLLFERVKPVYWSWKERTALAEAEVEYKELTHKSFYVLFHDTTSEAAVAIWTTTPWTLPSNSAVAVHPNEEYVGVMTDGVLVFVAEKRLDVLSEKGVVTKDVQQKLLGKELVSKYNLCNPLSGKSTVFLCDDFVEMTTGTGCVHLAPGHGELDYQLGLKYNLPVHMPVDEHGRWTSEVLDLVDFGDAYLGKHVLHEGNQVVFDHLNAECNVLDTEDVTHSYPTCWRSGTEVIFRATKQWFLNLEPLRDHALKHVENTKTFPESSKSRLMTMVKERPDWCLSRQRRWGVPLAFLRDKTTGEACLDEAVLFKTASQLSENGMDDWYRDGVDRFLPEGYDPENYEKVKDVLDVWFDSGLTWKTLSKKSNVYLEGNDQHRGWFQSSLWLGTALSGDAPFDSLVTHGFVVDEKGEKMSKSRGNVVSPQTVVKQMGMEVLRYWVASTDYTRDVKLSNDMLKRCQADFKKLRNTFRFMLSVLPETEPEVFSESDLLPVDYWILKNAQKTFEYVDNCFKNLDFCKGMHRLNEFCHGDLSGVYFSSCKDRLYCDKLDSKERRSVVYTLSNLLDSMMGLVAHLFTVTMDEVFEHTPKWFKRGRRDVFDVVYEPLSDVTCQEFDEDFWRNSLKSFNSVYDKLKADKKVRDKLELYLQCEDVNFTGAADWFGVSYFGSAVSEDVYERFTVDNVEFSVARPNQVKCQRCWKHLAEEELCERCLKAV